MTDLVAWLRNQLDEDERVANSATSGPWDNNDPMTRDAVRAPAVDNWVADCRYEQMGPFAVDNATHIARWHPPRALAEVEAARRILDLHEIRRVTDEFEGKIRPEPIVWCDSCDEPTWCPTLRLLALPYADQPGYREEWKP
ncbi:MAG: DUF6221 family protein [Micromonosporaceae bacterium]